MDRDITNNLIEWKSSHNRKPLILTGVRQCGKTYTLQNFAKEHYQNMCYINFEESKKFSQIFDFDFDTDRIIFEIETLKKCKIVPNETLIIFDEVQECPKAITSLKYFAENAPDIHIACAGSLLGVALNNKNISFPVGKVNRLQMYPLSFKEFVAALGEGSYIKLFENWSSDRPIDDTYRDHFETLLNAYNIVGGMPDAVMEYAQTRSFEKVARIQNDILSDYADDFSKHAPVKEIEKLRLIWESVPKQLARDNNKFMFSHVSKGKRAHELEAALQWLKNAGLLYALELVQNPELPLSVYANASFFKIYMSDPGLLSRRLNLHIESFTGSASFLSAAKGAIAENYVMNELIKQNMKPFYWKSKNTAEIDFLFESNSKVVPVEVKAAYNTHAKSYKLFCDKYKPEVGFKLSMKNISCNLVDNTKTYSLPLYMLWNINHYLMH